MRFFKEYGAGIVAAFVITGAVLAGTIKTWSSGETLNASDLNANFQHIHNTMVGGHGARLVNSDVSASAGIAHSKLATPALVPKAWALVASDCTASPCTITVGSGISSVTRSGTGLYTITFTNARVDANYLVIVNGGGAAGGPITAANFAVCLTEYPALTTSFNVDCYKNDGTAAQDTKLEILVMDNL